LGNIGAVYLTSGNIEKSTDYYKLLLEAAKEDDDLYGVSRAAYELGMIYRRQGEWEKALEYAYQSLEIARSMQYKEIETVANQNLAHIYFLKEPKDLEKAMNYAEESIRLAHELGNLRIVSASFNTLANVYLRQKRYQEAENAALKGWEIDSTYHAIGHSLLFNLAVSNLHLNRKDKTEAYLYKYVDYWNQYINKTTQESIVEIQIKYETEKKEMQIAALEEERKLYAIIGIAGAVILILLAGLLLFLYRLNVQKSRMAEQQIKQFEQEKQLVATQALLAGETSERSRLARDLHDGLGGLLSVIKLNLKSIKNDAIPDTGQYDKALEMIDQSISELRRVAHHMMPESLIRYGLKTSLEDFCRVIPGAHFQYVGEDKRLDNRLEVVIYRCAYELINNVIKHANATIINVQLIADEGLISLSVSDNGRGFDTENIAAGSGLENIRTRISAYNGKLNIYSSPGNGTEVNIEIESKNPA
jgi:signal transduction histidine kinase